MRITIFALVLFTVIIPNISFAFQAIDEDIDKSLTLETIENNTGNPSFKSKYLRTHPWLTAKGIELFEKKSDLNSGRYLIPDKYKNEILYGSIEEDYDAVGTASPDGRFSNLPLKSPELGNPLKSQRAFNHFYVGFNNYSGGLAIENINSGSIIIDLAFEVFKNEFVNGLPAPVWALFNYKNTGSTNTANATVFEKDVDLSTKFKALGHVLHLLEDMGVPAHVRNDPHPPFINPDPYEHILSTVTWDKYYNCFGSA